MANSKSPKDHTIRLTVSLKEYDLLEQIRKLTASLTPQDLIPTFSTLRRIFDNIIQHPNDDKYRQIKLTSKTFSSKVWQYPAGEELMKMSGWVLENDHVRLRDGSCVQILYQLLEQKLKENEIAKSTHTAYTHSTPSESTVLGKRPRYKSVSTDASSSNSAECFILSEDVALPILNAIFFGKASKVKDLLKQYDTSCVKNMRVDLRASVPIIGVIFKARQTGIARILVNEYGVDANITDEDSSPYFLKLFEGCDSTEPCQSLIIQFIKEFKINVHKHDIHHHTALHLAVVHKLFSVIRFLVEDCKIDINYISNPTSGGGTPLHMAYGIGERNIAQYLIEHGADQEAIDDDGRKPKDYEFYEDNAYSILSKFCIRLRVIEKTLGPELEHYSQLCEQGLSVYKAMDLTFEKFPSLQNLVDGGYVSWITLIEQDANGGLINQRILEATPTLKELNRYITDMAPSYYDIGLQLDIVNSQLKLIKNDPSLSDLKEKCRKMLEVWLENDASATWKKLCDTLEEEGLSVLAEQMKYSQWT